MVDKLQIAFNKLTRRYFECPSSSEEEMVVEYPLQYAPVKKYCKIEKRSSREEIHKIDSSKRKRSSSRGNLQSFFYTLYILCFKFNNQN